MIDCSLYSKTDYKKENKELTKKIESLDLAIKAYQFHLELERSEISRLNSENKDLKQKIENCAPLINGMLVDDSRIKKIEKVARNVFCNSRIIKVREVKDVSFKDSRFQNYRIYFDIFEGIRLTDLDKLSKQLNTKDIYINMKYQFIWVTIENDF